MTMVSSPDDCKQLVAGNYDVIISESPSTTLRQIITDYLELFHQHEQQLGQPNCAYVEEFRMLKELSKALKEDKANLYIGELDQNQKKNRYKDILPFSHTRVILKNQPNYCTLKKIQQNETNEVTNSDNLDEHYVVTANQEQEDDDDDDCYINANYIRGPSGHQQAYIACQGPLPCTLNDFWRMIWDCNVSVVIMACNEFESGKPKCELYWPDQIDASQTYGNIQVTLSRVRQLNTDFLIRKLCIKLLEPDSSITATSRVQHEGDSNNNSLSADGTTAMKQNVSHPNDNYDSSASERSYPPQQSINMMIANQLSHLHNNINNHHQRHNPSPSISNNSSHTSGSSNGSHHSRRIANSSESISTTSDITTGSSAARGGSMPLGAGTTAGTNTTSNGNCNEKNNSSSTSGRTVLAERTICQFHYTTWPDHGVPDLVSPILELVRLVREVQPTEEKPILVHCSAGCGRTGTICCIDYVWGLLRQGKLDEDFNLCRIISDMRQQRMAMVQTLEQYILCHRAVAALFIQQLQQIDSEQDLGPVFI